MISIFINRKEELTLLEKEWNKKNGSLVILYGRRRIGKTRLLMEFSQNKNGLFYIGEDTSSYIQITELKERFANFIGDNLLRELDIKDWSQLFNYIIKNTPKERWYLIIDEFTYLIKSDKRILSVLQKCWDTFFSKSNILIILSGSLLGLMSEKVLSSASPLYGRRTRDILLKSLDFSDSRNFLKMKPEDQLKTYFILGGVPEYLLKASEYNNLTDFLESEFFNKYGYFYREPYFILSQEFREIKIYFSIMNAIAFGNTKPTRIANFVGLKAREIYPYLENLIRLGLIERQVSILNNSKRGLYVIKDDIFDFWFNFIFKNRDKIEMNKFKPKIENLNTFFGKKFEQFCLNEVIHKLNLNMDEKGRWWRGDQEIDIIAVNEKQKRIWFFECKWSNLHYKKAESILKSLKDKARLVQWKNNDRSEIYGLIAKKIEGKEKLIQQGFLVLDLEDMLK